MINDGLDNDEKVINCFYVHTFFKFTDSCLRAPRLSPDCSWDRLQYPRNPEMDKVGTENGWID